MENGPRKMIEVIATDLPRLIACNGSNSMAVFKPAIEDAAQIIRDEGIAAHEMAVLSHNGTPDSELIGKQASNGVFMTEDMLYAVTQYIDLVHGRSPDRIFSQMEIETSHQNGDLYRVNGRADNITHTCDNVLFIDDFKYGYRIVGPLMNWTLISHAIGYILNNPNQEPPERFVFSIIQPRAIHRDGPVRTWEITHEQFYIYWSHLIDELSDLKNELNTGDHCKRCPSLVYCNAATQAGYNALEVSDIVFHEDLTNDELSKSMDLLSGAIKRAQNKLEALEGLALHKIKNGEVVENYTPENSLGNKTWLGYVNPALIKSLTGVDISSQKMITPAQAIKNNVPKELVEGLTHRPNRGVKLKRITANEKASKMFANLKG